MHFVTPALLILNLNFLFTEVNYLHHEAAEQLAASHSTFAHESVCHPVLPLKLACSPCLSCQPEATFISSANSFLVCIVMMTDFQQDFPFTMKRNPYPYYNHG